MTSVASAHTFDARRRDLLDRYDGNVPRYTSYPTAVEFSSIVDEDVAAAWLGQLPLDERLSVYVHIPFCKRLCWYCGCNTRAVRNRTLISDYIAFLGEELALVEKALPGRPTAGAIHLGGGTPNMLSREDLGALFRGLRHVFRVSPGAEIAAELDPSVLTREWVVAAAFHGLTRASVGVQDLSPHVQQAVNRIEPFEVVERAVGWLREAGVASVNLDLMYGLPRQRVEDVLATLDKVLTLRPERLALFGYAHVPWVKAHQKLIEASDLPGAAERLDQSEAAAAKLTDEGYVRIGLDHFALPDDPLALALQAGTLRRNFQGYTADPHMTLIGLGASSISSLPQGYYQNDATELGWRRRLQEGRLPVVRGVALTDEDRFRGDIIETLMCRRSVDLAQVCARHGRDLETLAEEETALRGMAADGLVALAPGRVEMTRLGQPWLRSVARVFDRRSGAQSRFSRVL
ncbi:MAG TPA: oxygen-independent coproporphyrinogen III oxidase [Caulobacter sp.]|nr:oxygen-independent coproporphyrinogen III oxidase [Caulobacter sp.]